MSSTRKRFAIVAASTGLVVAAVAGTAVAAADSGAGTANASGKHVLLLSVDGLHQADLEFYVAHNPGSALANLVRQGRSYTHAQTPFPSDSFPGMVGQVTGGNPASTGIYYDDTWNTKLLPAGTTSCAGVKPGVEIDFTEDLDKDKNSIDAGQGLPGLPDNILQMTGDPKTVIDPAKLPVDPKTCKPVFPHSYLQANTIFEVARQAGLRTAWSDKHPAYEIFNGPSGSGVQDLFAPEINSQTPGTAAGQDWTTDNAKTRQYDGYKAKAVLNEIDGFDHSRSNQVGTPAIFGMNFQSVSTSEKLPTSDGLTGGYQADGTPGPLLTGSMDFVNSQVESFVKEVQAQHLEKNTTIVLSAKHGQSPTKPAALTRIDDGPLLDGLNAAWKAAHPGSADLVAHAVDDDGMLLWLNDRSPAATDFAKKYLLAQSGSGNGIDGKPKPFTQSGLSAVHAGADAAKYFNVAVGDPAVPDLVGLSQYGVVYTGGMKKIAEHGGNAPDDRSVPLVIAAVHGANDPSADPTAGTDTQAVETTQVAPTVLHLLGLDPSKLQAVRAENTAVLPGL